MTAPTHRRAPHAARWLVPTALAGAFVGLASPAVLHAQARGMLPTPQPASPVATQPLPAPPTPAVPAPQVATTPAPLPTAAAADALQLGHAFTEVAERVLPSVVSIHVEAEAGVDDGVPFIPFMPPGGGRGAPLVRGSGSGVIVREDGIILTNNHVVERARRLTVHLRDGRTLRARVLGTDPAVDLALIKIDATGLPAARLGDSDQARVGEWVLAIGAPLGLEATVTHGVISATGRGGLGANEIEDYLQTDASINPGNSGGPLVNLRGEVLGINTMIVGRNTGIGMAVPSRMAQSVVEQILRTGRVTRGWVGIGVQDLTSELAQTMGVGAVRGAVVNQLEPGAPAARAGLQVGDVVTAIDGQPVSSSHDLVRSITRHGAGERVLMSVLRSGRAHTIAVTTVPRPGGERAQLPDGERDGAAPTARPQGLGLRLATLSPELAARLGARTDGVIVADVEPGSAADEAGLRRGDLILQADGREVRSPADVTSAASDRRLTLLIRRGQAQVFVPVMMD
jgi:Do/DeqQ family serine protease